MNRESDTDIKKKLHDELVKTTAPIFLGELESFAKKYDGFLANKKVRLTLKDQMFLSLKI